MSPGRLTPEEIRARLVAEGKIHVARPPLGGKDGGKWVSQVFVPHGEILTSWVRVWKPGPTTLRLERQGLIERSVEPGGYERIALTPEGIDYARSFSPNPPPPISFANWHRNSFSASDSYTLYALTPEGHDELKRGILDFPTEEMVHGKVVYSVYTDRPVVYVELIEVRDSRRRKGIGTALWRELERLWPGYSFPRGAFMSKAGIALRKAVGKNPDARERELERAWRGGDEQAGLRLLRSLTRRTGDTTIPSLEEDRIVTTLRETLGQQTGRPYDEPFALYRQALRRLGEGLPEHRVKEGSVLFHDPHGGSGWTAEGIERWLRQSAGGMAGNWVTQGNAYWRWYQENNWGDPPYSAVWTNFPLRALVTYTEGEITIELADSVQDYFRLYNKYSAFYSDD